MTGMIDYHIHTPLCNHAKGSMEKYIQTAVDIGLREICFLDHLTINRHDQGLSMTPAQVPLYYQAIQVLKQRYGEVIKVKAGLEIDFNPAFADLFREITGTFSFDVIGTSLHFPDGLDIVSRSSGWARAKYDADHVYRLYLKEYDRMLDYNYFDVLCHFDLVKKFGCGSARLFNDRLDEILFKIKEKNLIMEVNTSGFDHLAKEAYPSVEILKKCNRLGIDITLGSDAHSPADVGRHYDRIFPLLASAGYTRLAVFTKRNCKFIQMSQFQNAPFRPISTSDKNFNPRNT